MQQLIKQEIAIQLSPTAYGCQTPSNADFPGSEVHWPDRSADRHEDVAFFSNLRSLSRPSCRTFNELLSEVLFALVEGHSLAVSVVELPFGRLARNDLTQIADLFSSPAVLQSRALIFLSVSALSESSAAISSMISSGLRCVISSPPLGFFTERSKVVWPMLLASTLQLLGESANAFCSFTNSARSSSLSGFVLPRLRPGSSW